MERRGMAPGFRFSPTDEELVVHYLMNYACGKEYPQGVIAEVDLYKHEPWELPGKSVMSSRDPVWYFFNSQDKKHHQSARFNRTTSKGYWKATGKDRKIRCGAQTVGTKKTLIYYEGRAPSGKRTDWIMHEYKLDEELEKRSNTVCTAALCRVRKKGGPGPRNGEQFGASTLYGDDGEDVEDNGNENLPNSTEGGDEVKSSFHSEDLNVLENMSSLPMLEMSKDYVADEKETAMVFPPLGMQGGRDGIDTDLYAFLESFLADTALTTTSGPEMLSSITDVGDPAVDGDYLDSLPDPQSLLLDIEKTENEREEQILRQIMHLTDGGQCETIELGSMARTVSLSDIDTTLGIVNGDFIELNDMNSPLDDFVPRSPVPGGYYCLDGDDEQQQQPMTSTGFEYLGWSPDVLHAQGLASRRARLRIPIPTPSRITTHADMPFDDACNTVHQVQIRKETNDVNIQIGTDVCENGSKIAAESSSGRTGSFSDSNTTVDNVECSSTSVLCKHMPSSSIVICEEKPSQLFFARLSHTNKEGCGASNVSEGLGLNEKMKGRVSYDTPDCEAGESKGMTQSQVSHSVSSRDKDTWQSTIGVLVAKTKSLSLGSQLSDLEGKLSSGFNDKVCALGKPAAQLLPASSYSRLKTCVMTTLLRLAVAVLLLHLFLLGFHMLTK